MYGNKIKQLRKNAGLNQADLAGLVGVSRPNISFWENAEYPPLEAIVKICKALRFEIWKFFNDDASETRVNALPPRYKKLIESVSGLNDEDYNDLLDMIEIFLRKNNRVSAQKERTGTDDYSLPFMARNLGYIALEKYTERILRLK
jgi:transcriptional regulator with XRE-family HTH domain